MDSLLLKFDGLVRSHSNRLRIDLDKSLFKRFGIDFDKSLFKRFGIDFDKSSGFGATFPVKVDIIR